MSLETYVRNNCNLADWEQAQALHWYGQKLPLPSNVIGKIEECVEDYCYDNDLNLDDLEYDTTDLFFETL